MLTGDPNRPAAHDLHEALTNSPLDRGVRPLRPDAAPIPRREAATESDGAITVRFGCRQ